MLIAELRKVTTVRWPWIISGVTVLLVTAKPLAAVLLPDAGSALATAAGQRPLLSQSNMVLTFVLLAGILVATTDHRHGAIVPTLLASPVRWRVSCAKLAVGAMIGLVLGLMGMAVTAVATPLALSANDAELALTWTEIAASNARGLISLALGGVLGVGLGLGVRNQPAAIAGTLVGTLFIVPLLQGISRDSIWWTPTWAQLVFTDGPGTVTPVLAEPPFGMLGALGVISAWAGVMAVLGAGTLERRDVT